MTDPSTTELLSRVCAPRSEAEFAHAVGELIFRYKDLVYAQALRISRGDRALADDVFQETFIRLFTWLKARRGARPLHSVAGLLKVMARRAAIDLLRKDRLPVGEPQAEEEAEPEDEWRLDTMLYAREVIEELDLRSRNVLYLTFAEGLSAVEIARRLDLTSANVRVLRFRAIQRIRARRLADAFADTVEPV